MVEQAINLTPKKINLKYEQYKPKIKSICITRLTCSSLAIVSENMESIVAPQCVIASVGVVIGRGATPSTSSEPSVVSKRIPILKVTFGSISCVYDVTTKSTSIFPPSFCFSLFYELDSNAKPNSDANLEWVCVLLSLKGDILRCGITCW